jgi:hypothetical protein
MTHSIDTISVPSIWSKGIDSVLFTTLLEEKQKKERDLRDVLEQGGVLFNTHATVVNGVMYVTYILTK